MIIFINGSINAEKSTVAQLLSESLGKTAVIDVDSLRSFIQWMPLVPAVPINLEGTVLLTKNFIKHDLHVIIPYPLSQNNYDFLITNLEETKTEIKVFTLNPSFDVITKQRGNRELSPWELERIQYHYDSGLNIPTFGTVIDNSLQTPEETVEEILRQLTSENQL